MTALLLKTDVASKLIEELNTETVFSLFGGKGVYNEVSRKNPTTKEEKRWLYL